MTDGRLEEIRNIRYPHPETALERQLLHTRLECIAEIERSWGGGRNMKRDSFGYDLAPSCYAKRPNKRRKR
jgi:hypothetical protein